MPPGGPNKRKRNDRNFSHDEGQGRPSPHRPESLNLAQQNQRHDGRRDNNSRRGRGGSNYNNSNNHNQYHNSNAAGPGAHGGHGGQGQGAGPAGGQPTAGHNVTGTSTPSRATPSAAASPSLNPSTPSLHPSTPSKRDGQSSEPPAIRPSQPAQSSQPTQPTPALQLQAPRAQSPPREAPQPYTYDYLTDETLSKWQESGKQSVVDAFANAEDKEATASAVIQELIRSTLDERMPPGDSGAALKQILDLQSDNDRQELQSLVADTINVLDERDWKRSSLRHFIAAAAISPDVLREELDVETLQALGLVRNTFSTMRNRKTTNLIYRQANFNLLREESEGYSKLITEYFNVSHVDNLSEPVAEDAFQRIKALVGSFDLDVGRVLDITLDLMANLLVKNFRFFVKFLRASSWWPEDNIPEGIEWTSQHFNSLPAWALPGSGAWNTSSDERERLAGLKQTRDVAFWKRLRETGGMDAFFELGARKITNLDNAAVQELLNTELKPELNARGQDTNIVRRTRLNNARTWMRETGCLPPVGNPDAAQILGFKLAFYSSDARNKKDEMPDNLIWMSALLIKIGFISLRDLYPHLYPADEHMADVKTKLQEEKAAREKAARPGGSNSNALAMAGALADDTLPNPAVRALREAEKGAKSPKPDSAADAPKPTDDLPEPANQKIMLLKSLLLIGALPEALFILGKFPWLAELVHDLPDYIHRILHVMLAKVYEPTRPLAARAGLSEPKDHIGDPAGLPKGSLKFVQAKKPKSLRWANLERGDIGDETEYRFYWEDWTDNIPVCQTVDDVFQMCSTILNYSGVKVGRDSALLMKLTRIGKKSLTDDPSEANSTRWVDLCKRLLVPALSLTKHNTGDVNEVFELLKLFPIDTRYSIYAEWHFGATSRNPDIQSAFKLTQAETRDCLKRISKTNVRAMGKALSKVAFSSPGVVMQVAIHQMEAYDNLIDVVVECVRYFSMLGYDVLVWSLMNALGDPERNRMQADGMLTSRWLGALSNFAGSIFKRYSAIDPAPILQYVTDQLRKGKPTDLEILEQIITGMAGIRSDVTFNEAQVLAMAGGKVLQAQTLVSVADERHKMDKTSRRLIKALIEPGLAGQLLISIAQERQMYPNHASVQDAPLKVLGNNIDKIHEVFNQYLDTLRSNMSTKDFDAVVPDIVTLNTEFGLEASVAFAIGRASIAAAIAESDAARDAQQQEDRARKASEEKPTTNNGDVAMADADEKPAVKDVPDSADAEMKDARGLVEANGVPTATPTPAPEPAQEVDTAYWHRALHPMIERLQELMAPEAGSTINVPFYVTFWTLSLEDILVNSASYEQELTTQNHLVNQITNDRSDMSVKAVKDREARKKAILELKEKLTAEMREQIKTYQRVRGRLIREKAHWFSSLTGNRDAIYNNLLQNCFLPRILLSPLDAHYSFTMIKFLHNNATPGFRTMWLYAQLFRKQQLATMLYQCTAREAENFGRFLNEVLKDFSTWHLKKDVFEKNAHGIKRNLPGFVKDHRDPTGAPEDKFLEYEEFRQLLWAWHSNLNQTFQLCFQSGEYMHIRNAIIVLRAIFEQFPRVDFMGSGMVKLVEAIGQDDARGDLKLAAMSLRGNLKRMEKTWIIPQAFRFNKNAQKSEKSATSSSQPGTPAPLNPAASEFKPPVGAEAVTNGDSARSEDGEIDEDRKETASEDASAKGDSQQKGESRPSADLPKKVEPSRAATPAVAKAPTPTPGSRATSTQPARTPHALPSKPESRPPPARATSDRPVEPRPRVPRHDTRERGQPQQDAGRLEPPADINRTPNPRSREVSPGRRERDHSTDRRDYHTGPPRHDDRVPSRIPSQQDLRMLDRDSGYGPPQRRDAGPPMHSARVADGRGYANGTASMPPPPQADTRYGRAERGSQASRPVPVPSHGPPSAPSSQPGTPGVNPERLALIHGEPPAAREDRRPRDESRRDRDDRRDRGSGPQSPRPPPKEGRKPLDPNPFESRGKADEPRRTTEPGDPAPTGPRSGRSGRNEPPKGRDLFEATAPARRPVDQNHGRLTTDDRPPQDSNFGRLNAVPEPPSGPRSNFNGPPGQGGRNFTPTGPGSNSRPGQSPMSQPFQPPGRPGTIQQQPANNDRGRSQYDRSGAPPSAPSGPASSPQAAPGPIPVGIHPSRMGHIPALEVQTHAPTGPRNAPTGPASSTPMVNSPVGNKVPVGPASAGDKRKFAGLNETLTSGGNNNVDRGASIRGRASRQGSTAMAPSPTVSGAPTAPGSTGGHQRYQQPAQPPQQQQQIPHLQPMHPSRMQPMDMPLALNDRSSGGGGSRRDDDRSDNSRHRSSRVDLNNPNMIPPVDDRSRHGGHSSHAPQDEVYERDSRSRNHNRSEREGGHRDRSDREGRRSHRDPGMMAQQQNMQPSSQFQPVQDQGYPIAPGRGYDNRPTQPPSAGGGNDYSRRDNRGPGGGGRDDGRSGGGSSSGGRGGGSERKRRGEDMSGGLGPDAGGSSGGREGGRGDKRRRSGM